MQIILSLMLLSISLFANIGKVSAVVGDASIQREDSKITAKVGTIIEEKDIVLTKNNSKVQLVFKDNTVITIGKDSALDISEYVYDTKNPNNSKTDFNFFKGAFKTITGNIGKINRDKFKLRTKSATIGIRGTTILANEQTIACLTGAVRITFNGQSIDIPAGFSVDTSVTPLKLEKLDDETFTKLQNQLNPKNKVENKSTNEDDQIITIKDKDTSIGLDVGLDNNIFIENIENTEDISENSNFEKNKEELDIKIEDIVVNPETEENPEGQP